MLIFVAVKKICLFVLGVVLSSYGFAQKKGYNGLPSVIWPKLYNIQYVESKDEYGTVEKPVFSPEVKNLNGKVITIPGYIVPFENKLTSSHLLLSSLPLNACFFCGVGGPETVAEIFLKKSIAYTDKPVEVRGVLRLNDSDPDKLIYILENAEVLGEVKL